MKIELDKIDYKIMPNFKGGEKEAFMKIVDDGANKIISGLLNPGASIGLHRHDDSSEIIFIVEGEGIAIFEGITETLKAGDCHYCPKGKSHSLINNTDGPLKFMAVVPKQ